MFYWLRPFWLTITGHKQYFMVRNPSFKYWRRFNSNNCKNVIYTGGRWFRYPRRYFNNSLKTIGYIKFWKLHFNVCQPTGQYWSEQLLILLVIVLIQGLEVFKCYEKNVHNVLSGFLKTEITIWEQFSLIISAAGYSYAPSMHAGEFV